MAALSETLLWIAIPNGITTEADGKPVLRLSLFVSPRLRGAQTLKDFQDFLDWPTAMAPDQVQFELEIDSGEVIPARISSPPPDPALWQALFSEQTPVADPSFDDYSGRPLVSFPVQQVLGYLKRAYSQIAANSPEDLPRNSGGPGAADTQVSLDRVFRDLVDLQTFLAGQADEPGFLSRTILDSMEQARQVARKGDAGGALIQPPGINGYASNSPQDNFYRSMLFHYRPADSKPVDLPASAAETRQQYTQQIDFHQMLASLNDYPELMRKLGLVIDLQVEAAAMPQTPDDMHKHKLRLHPTWQPADFPPEERTPWTAYCYAPQNGVDLFNPVSSSGEISSGLWTPHATDLSLVQVDVDGTALKTLNMASTLVGKAHPEDQPYDAPDQDGISTLRTKGVSLVLTDRANKINDRFNRSLNLNSLADAGQDIELFAEDLLRGYRLDVNDDGNWFSLHQRQGIYHPLNQAGQELSIPDEGFAQPSVTETPRPQDAPPDPGAEIFVHESLFTWDGWSLSAPRPGKSLSRSSRAPTEADPETQPQNIPNTAGTALPLEVTFQVQNGTLPRLRVGRKYQFRVRTVDLAGNSLQPEEATQLMQALSGQMKATFPEGDALIYARYEPVSPPELAPRLAYTAGESLERLVIRSNFDQTAEEYAAAQPDWAGANERHVAPPKAAQALVETLGMLDGGFDAKRQGLPPDQVQALIQEAYSLSVREKGSLNDPGAQVQFVRTGGTEVAPQVYAVHGEEQLILPYLPDPWAAGVVFFGLPGVPAGQPYVLKWDGPSWDELIPFRLRLVEGFDAPEWDPATHLLTVKLGKAQVAEVRLSSLYGGDLQATGLWQWLEEAQAQNTLSPDRLKELAQMVMDGKHWMFTPFRKLVLVHGVQQPLAEPRPDDLQSSRSERGQTALHLRNQVKLDSSSTAKLDLLATWQETRDDPAKPGYETVPLQAHVLELPVSFDGLPGRLTDPALQDIYQLIDEGYVLQFDTDFRNRDSFLSLKKSLTDASLTLEARRRVQDLLNLLDRLTPHEFGDTKYRQVTYQFSAAARFREYFVLAGAADLDGTRSSEEIKVEVPSTGKPDAPRLLYVLPTYGWMQSIAPNGTVTSTRRGGGLRVYLDRPWYSSGEGELLGIVVSGRLPSRWENLSQGFTPDTIYPYDTYWGDDPLWAVGKIALPRPENFPGAVSVGKNLRLSERPGDLVTVYGYAVNFDSERKLWYCDLDLNTGGFYYPFIRLALVRYQPNSLVDGQEQSLGSLHVSHVITTEIVQTTPDRMLTVTRAPGNPGRRILALTGPAPSGRRDSGSLINHPLTPEPVISGTNRVEASLEMRLANVPDDALGWQALPGFDPVGLESSPQTGAGYLWSGKVEIPAEAAGQTLRLVVRESEPYTNFTPGPDGKRLLSWRLVYMDWVSL